MDDPPSTVGMAMPSKLQSDTEWRIYPPPKPTPYQDGDLVFVRTKSAKVNGTRGVVRSVVEDRVLVSSGTREQSLSRKRLLPVYRSNVIVASETVHFRLLAASQLTCDDNVLEIGCSTGEASAVIVRYAKSWVGFDKSSEMIEQCLDKINKTKIVSQTTTEGREGACVVDIFANPVEALKHSKQFVDEGPNVVFIDIGGSRELCSVVETLIWCMKHFSPRLIIIKSQEMVAEIRQANNNLLGQDGRLSNSQWFHGLERRRLPHHPLQAPLKLSPNEIPICRYHNYHADGCKRKERCPFDHEYCHSCLERGHVALCCPNR